MREATELRVAGAARFQPAAAFRLLCGDAPLSQA